MAPYAVVQIGHTVFGTGDTEAQAINDAQEWVDNSETLKDDLVPHYKAVVGDLVLVKCTDELMEAVRQHGGDVLFDIIDNVATLVD